MKILFISIGTRGDIEPFLAIGEILHNKGNEVIYSFPAQHSELVPKGFNFFPLSPKFIELIESEEGKIMMGGKMGMISKIKALYKLYKKGKAINKLLVKEQYEIIEQNKPDRIIYNSKCNYPLIWSVKNNKKSIMISPVPFLLHYVEGNAHIGFNGNYGKFINKLTYQLANFSLVKLIKETSQNIPERVNLSRREIKKALFEENLIFTISPSLFPKPKNWPSNVRVLGYNQVSKKKEWKPSQKLIDFLAVNEKVLFLTFGSMVNPNPNETSHLLLDTLNKLKIPTLVNTASGGLVKLEEFKNNPLFYFVESIPYEWAFQKVYGVVHHGGSGTTHLALKNGCATLIIPHIIDQYGWNTLVDNLGAGPKGPSVKNLSKKKIEPLLSDLVVNKTYKLRVQKIAIEMNNEYLKEELYEFIMK